MRLLKYISIVILAILFVVNKSFSEMYYTSDVLLGEKAAGMGGTFSAIADGPSSCYYNPAGLVLCKVPYISVSAQIAEYKQQTGKYLISNDITEKEKFFSQEFVPSFWGIAKDFGPGRLGFSVAVPYYNAYELHSRFNNRKLIGLDSASIILDKKTMDKTYLIGPSYSYRINSKLSIGSTLYFHYKALKEQNNTYLSIDNKLVSYYRMSIDEANGFGSGFSGNLGLLYHATEKMNLSCVLKSGDYVTNTTNYRGATFNYNKNKLNGTTSAQNSDPLDEEVKNDFKMPPGTTIGFSYKPTPKFLFGCDIHYFLPISYDIDYYSLDPATYVYLAKSKRIIKNSIVNYNFGGEYMLREDMPLRFGFYTNNSLSPKIDINNQSEKQSHMDTKGFTLSSGIVSENSTLMFILKYGFGKGEMTSSNLDTNKMEKVDLDFVSYGLGFSGSYWF